MALGRMESFEHSIFARLVAASNKTQERIAVECGVTKGVVSHWLSGRNKPAPQHAPRLAAALGVTVLDLAGKTVETGDIVDLRMTVGMVGTQAADLAGLKRSQLLTLEAAVTPPKPEHLEALASVYGVTVEQIKRSWVNRRIYLFGTDSLAHLPDAIREYLSPGARTRLP